MSVISAARQRETPRTSAHANISKTPPDAKEGASVARVEIGGRRQGQDVWARWIDGRVQGDREFLKVAGLDPGTPYEDPHAFVELIEGLLDEGSESVVIDVPERPV
jgi:hypothetical protein